MNAKKNTKQNEGIGYIFLVTQWLKKHKIPFEEEQIRRFKGRDGYTSSFRVLVNENVKNLGLFSKIFIDFKLKKSRELTPKPLSVGNRGKLKMEIGITSFVIKWLKTYKIPFQKESIKWFTNEKDITLYFRVLVDKERMLKEYKSEKVKPIFSQNDWVFITFKV